MKRKIAPVACRIAACAWAIAATIQLGPSRASAQDDYEESSFSINGMLKMQGGVFVPLPSNKFEPHETIGRTQRRQPCDPRILTVNCFPRDHGQDPGTPSIARATLQLESQWDITDEIGLHAIVRGVRSLRLPADRYARIPNQRYDLWVDANERQDFSRMGEYAEEWVHDNYYTELDLREFYLDLNPFEWLSMRIGRQQVSWGDIGGYRLLDAVNPENATWHFGPLEAQEDIRIPMWMWLTTFDFAKIDHSLDLLWIPMIDRKKDTVTTPLSFVGAWGVPLSNTPTSFYSPYLEFRYPGHKLKDMRAGLRWKGNLGETTSYSLVYLYTHQFSPPVISHGEYSTSTTQSVTINPDMPTVGTIVSEQSPNPDVLDRIVLTFPRQHIAGFSLEQTIPAIGTVARVEAAVEPNRTYSSQSNLPVVDPDNPFLLEWRRKQYLAVNYAFVLQRATMIRFLNPTQSFLLVAQFFHSFVPGIDMEAEGADLWTQVPGYNNWQAQRHSYRVVGVARTTYLNGKISLGLMGVYVPTPYAKDSGFYSIDVGFRLGAHYRLNIIATDFIGKDPYRDIGLYRDRDEIMAAISVLF